MCNGEEVSLLPVYSRPAPTPLPSSSLKTPAMID